MDSAEMMRPENMLGLWRTEGFYCTECCYGLINEF